MDMFIIGLQFGFGLLVCITLMYLLGSLVLWPFNLKRDLKFTEGDKKLWMKRCEEYQKELRVYEKKYGRL